MEGTSINGSKLIYLPTKKWNSVSIPRLYVLVIKLCSLFIRSKILGLLIGGN